MEQPTSNPISPNVKPQSKKTEENFVGTLISSILLALAVGVVLLALLLPKACNEDPQTPVMKLISEIQKLETKVGDQLTKPLTKPLTKADTWLENNLNVVYDRYRIFGRIFGQLGR